MHILPNISRSKDNQTMKFGQLIEYNMRNFFLEKSYAKCDGETVPRPFSIKSKLYLWINRVKFFTICFYCMPSSELSKIIGNKPQTTHYIIISEVKHLSCCILLTDQISLSGCLYFMRYWATYVLLISF